MCAPPDFSPAAQALAQYRAQLRQQQAMASLTGPIAVRMAPSVPRVAHPGNCPGCGAPLRRDHGCTYCGREG